MARQRVQAAETPGAWQAFPPSLAAPPSFPEGAPELLVHAAKTRATRAMLDNAVRFMRKFPWVKRQ